MDKAAIFSEALHRNALRRAHGLPLLDVRAAYADGVWVAMRREYRTICAEHADEREAIRDDVLAKFRAKYGADFGNSAGGCWAIGAATDKQFTAYMAAKYDVCPPRPISIRNSIRYGRTHTD